MGNTQQRIDLSNYGTPQAHAKSAAWPDRAEPYQGRRESARGFAGLAALLVLNALTVAIARSGVSAVEGITAPTPAVIGFVWVMQGLAAVIYFVLAVRWLRS